jgi:hypothetical protein
VAAACPVLLAGKEADERPPPPGVPVPDGPTEHRVALLESIQHRVTRRTADHVERHLPGDTGQGPEVVGEHDADHGSVWTSTERTAGRSRTIGAQLSPESAEA